MQIRLITFLIFILINTSAFSQSFVWAKSMTGTESYGYSIATDKYANVYSVGYFQGTIDFDPGIGTYNLSSTGIVDSYISKLDASGNFVWAKRIGGLQQTISESVIIDDSSNILITGWFEGTTDFNPGTGVSNLTSPGAYDDNFILKLDSAGNFVWVKSFFGNSIFGKAITFDKKGNIYTTGSFVGGTIDFDPGIGTYNITTLGSAVFVSKLSPSGNFIWAKALDGAKSNWGYDVKVDDDGNVYTTGGFEGTVDFDPDTSTYQLASNGSQDAFISKLDSSGKFIWAKKIGGITDDFGKVISIDSLNNIFLTGSFSSVVDFDPGLSTTYLSSAGNFDGFILKLDSNGNFSWVKRIGGSGNDGFTTILAFNNLFVVGIFENHLVVNTISGPDSIISSGNYDIFISKLDTSGNINWINQIGGINIDEANSLAIDKSLNIYTTGVFQGTTDFDPSSGTYILNTSGNQGNAFVLKLCSVPNKVDTLIGSKSVCLGSNGTYFVKPVELATGYFWTVPQGTIINAGQNTNSINLTFGSISGNITVTPFNSCNNGSTENLFVKVNPLPIIKALATPQEIVCQGDAVTLLGSGGSNYIWSGGVTNGTPFIPQATTKYTVIGTDSNGCTNSDSITIKIILKPKKIAKRKYYLCVGKTTTLSAENDSMRYLWNTNDTLQHIVVNVEGKYFVKIYNGFCFLIDTIEVITFNTTKPIILIQNNQLISTNGNSYKWFNDSLIPSENKQKLNPKHNGFYKVLITDSNGCEAVSDPVYFEQIFSVLRIYPNPSRGFYTIELPNGGNKEYLFELFDLLGRKLEINYSIKDGVGKLDLSNYASASYVLKISNNSGEISVRKIVKF